MEGERVRPDRAPVLLLASATEPPLHLKQRVDGSLQTSDCS
jgi:hypothetical protein